MDFEPFAAWTDDCQGKKNYDFPVIGVNTRYWSPGGMIVYDATAGRFVDQLTTNHTATCSLEIVHRGTDDEFPDRYSLIERDFSGDSFEAVKADVEAWAREQYAKAVKAVVDAFYADPNGSPR